MLLFRQNRYKKARSMLKPLSHVDQIAFSDLVDKCHDAAFDADFPLNGSFHRQMRDGREYWYYRGYTRPPDGSNGASYLKYAGPTSDTELTKRIDQFGIAKADYSVRRDLAAKLRRTGLPAPSALEGAVIQTLAQSGLFRLRATLIGSLAYQTYAGLLGVRFNDANYRTQDIDFAQYHGIAISIDESIGDVGNTIQKIDPTFSPLFDPNSPNLVCGYRNKNGFKVEFLTPNRGRRENEFHLTKMPALGGIGAQPLAYLDFLIRNPVRSVLLHEAGVGVIIPDPSRYAVHKLIISTRRQDAGKARKDLAQAISLIDGLIDGFRATDLGLAWKEAWARGPKWRQRLIHGALKLSDAQLTKLKDATATAPDINVMPIAHNGFLPEKDPRASLTSLRKIGGRDSPGL